MRHEEDWVGIVGHCSGLGEAQWREIKEKLAKRGVHLDAQTLSKLAEIPGVVIEAARTAIEAENVQPTRAEMVKKAVAARESREFDDTDLNMLGLIEPNFSDRQRRTAERVRKLADKAVRDFRQQGKGNKPFHPRPEGIDSATLCALIVFVKLGWPGVRNRQTQAMCEALYAAAGGDIKRRGWTSKSWTEGFGFWRDHLREAQRRFGGDQARRQWRDHVFRGYIESALAL